jgi:hypothetical protein
MQVLLDTSTVRSATYYNKKRVLEVEFKDAFYSVPLKLRDKVHNVFFFKRVPVSVASGIFGSACPGSAIRTKVVKVFPNCGRDIR